MSSVYHLWADSVFSGARNQSLHTALVPIRKRPDFLMLYSLLSDTSKGQPTETPLQYTLRASWALSHVNVGAGVLVTPFPDISHCSRTIVMPNILYLARHPML